MNRIFTDIIIAALQSQRRLSSLQELFLNQMSINDTDVAFVTCNFVPLNINRDILYLKEIM